MLSRDELVQFEKLLKPLKEGQERIEKTQQEQGKAIHEQGSAIVRLEQRQAQTNTIVAKIKTVVEITEETVNNMDEGLKEVVKDHRDRIKRLEEQTRTTSHKN